MEKYIASFASPDNCAPELPLAERVINMVKEGINAGSFAELSSLYHSGTVNQDEMYTAILGSIKKLEDNEQRQVVHDEGFMKLLREIGVPEVVIDIVFPNLKTDKELEEISRAA